MCIESSWDDEFGSWEVCRLFECEEKIMQDSISMWVSHVDSHWRPLFLHWSMHMPAKNDRKDLRPGSLPCHDEKEHAAGDLVASRQ